MRELTCFPGGKAKGIKVRTQKYMESFANTRYNTYIMRILVSVAGAEEDGWLMEGMLYVGSLSYGYGVG